MKRVSFLSGSNLIFAFVIAQLSSIQFSVSAQALPKVIPPSPEAAALFHFAEYPMDYSTGLPSINIPIYNVQSGSLSVPISISNHASGRKITDQDGPVALGWSLNAGGMVSRTIYGAADFGAPNYATYYFPTPFRTIGISPTTDLGYLEKIIHYDNTNANILPWTESEYDIFSYTFNGNGGKFLFKDNYGVKTPALLPYKPYKITPTYSSLGLSNIDIIDDKGTLYKFAATENAGSDNAGAVTGLSLMQMISADKADTIFFRYASFIQWRLSFTQQRTLIDAWSYSMPYPSSTDLDHTSEISNRSYYQIARLTEIDFKQGKVLFNLVNGSDKIDNIQVLNTNNETIKTIQLSRSQLDYFTQGGSGGNPSMTQTNNKLDALVFKDRNGTAVENYNFQYYPTTSPMEIHYCDWWGYYNASGYINMLPTYNNIPITGAGGPQNYDLYNGPYNREPNLEALKSGVIKKIFFPTGGSTEFIYENNRYLNTNTNQVMDGPGLRIAQINTDDAKGGVFTKTYKYGLNEIGNGFLELIPGINTMSTEISEKFLGYQSGVSGSDRQRTFFSTFVPELSAMADRPVLYTQVTEYHGTLSNNIGKTVYNYDYNPWASAGMPAFGFQTIPKMHIASFNYWNTPSLIKQTDYKSVTNGGTVTYFPRREVNNGYSVNTIEDISALHVQRLINYPPSGWGGAQNPPVPEPTEAGNDIHIYTYIDYHIPSGVKNLTSTTETLYTDDGVTTIGTPKTYVYNANNFLQSESFVNSKGESVLTEYTYPSDAVGVPVHQQMIAANMLSFPFEQKVSNSLVLQTKTTNNYKNWGSSNINIKTETVEVTKLSNPSEIRLRYFNYDNAGNPLSVAKENDIKNSYIWDYLNTYPVAQVTNAIQSDIAYTSFEADGTGGWNGIIQASIVNNLSVSITGKKYYSATGFSLAKAIVSANTYIVSYWSNSGSYAVNGTSGTGLRTIGSWTYYEHNVVTGANATITITGTGGLDELRLYPSKAQMVSNTYEPLIGITSQCDANNRIIYYKYDFYGRLLALLDEGKNVLKRYCYTYQGQTENCSVFGNAPQSVAFTRNNCTGGATGSQVYFPVAANLFYASTQAAADALAVNYANANGQAYADQNGTCSGAMVTVNGSSVIPYGYNVQFVNTVTSAYYSMYLYPSGSSSVQMPAGVYTVSFVPGGTSYNTTFRVNGYSSYGSSPTFYNINISSGSQVIIGY